ncbi:MAG TPA: PD-(D/E)XK nuclease family protein [Longimicrobiaceae bacterium]|nr:PD-(D/E)XK nuclease family protein [Longimicrobiaceae bacterium]
MSTKKAWTPGPHPEFSISHRVIDMLEWCPRKFRHDVHTSWLGWIARGEPGPDGQPVADEARLAYRLKKLTSLHAVIGTAAHLEAERFVKAVRDDAPLPGYEEVRARLQGALNRAYTASLNRSAFLRSPKAHAMVFSAYYSGRPSIAELESAQAKVDPIARGICESEFWSEIQGLEKEEHRAIETLDWFDFEGVRINVKADLITAHVDGDVQIVDFKTTRDDEAPHLVQLSLYALYATTKLGLDFQPGYWRGLVVNFLGRTSEYILEERHLEQAADRLRRAIREIRGYLADPATNEPRAVEDFPLVNRAQMEGCRWCPFLQLCAPELPPRISGSWLR